MPTLNNGRKHRASKAHKCSDDAGTRYQGVVHYPSGSQDGIHVPSAGHVRQIHHARLFAHGRETISIKYQK